MKSPLRYPGGKTRAVRILSGAITTNYPGRKVLLSPFMGGGSLELALASEGFEVRSNDLFAPLVVFWRVLARQPTELAALVRSMMPVSKEDFYKYRGEVASADTRGDDLRAAALFFVINRCSFSGSTFCGGYSREAAAHRLTTSSVDRLASSDTRGVRVDNMDYEAFLNQNPETPDTVVYADPPYYISSYIYGRDGDLHEAFDHERFSRVIRARRDWVVSYNDCAYIRGLYEGCRIESVSWSYGMNKSKKSSEILIFPPS